MHEEFGNLEKGLHIGTPNLSGDMQKEIDSPDAVLKYLVFPYLDFKDILKPICKLWTRLANSNSLWKHLYLNHFGTSFTRWSILTFHSEAPDWKLLFRSKFLSQYNVRGLRNDFGWLVRICPTVGCNKELRTKLEYEMHVLRHDQKYCLDQMKNLKKIQRDQKRLGTKRRKKAGK